MKSPGAEVEEGGGDAAEKVGAALGLSCAGPCGFVRYMGQGRRHCVGSWACPHLSLLLPLLLFLVAA